VVESLSSKHKALGSVPSSEKKKEKKRKGGGSGVVTHLPLTPVLGRQGQEEDLHQFKVSLVHIGSSRSI